MKLLLRIAGAVVVIVVLLIAADALYIELGMHAHAGTNGTISGTGVQAPVEIARDARGVPHINAKNEHDLFFSEGYVEASDRLFQMDLLRRYTEGKLAEVLGKPALVSDSAMRGVPIDAIADKQWQRLSAQEQAILAAFSDGVNAAMVRQPLPVEFRILAYRPQPWTTHDSLAVAMATVLDLTDDWNAIEERNHVYRKGGLRALEERFPLTDPCYNAPVTGGLQAMAGGDACHLRSVLVAELGNKRAALGSNEWAAGAAHTTTGRALLANDPHLSLRIPGVWYLIEMNAPRFHAAGATFPGLPGVVLGHNDHVAWGATNGTVTSLSTFAPPKNLNPAYWQTETFHVRFSGDVTKRYYRAPREFGITTDDGAFVLVRWNAYESPLSAAGTFLNLDRAATIADAETVLRGYPGPTQNFVLADDRGNAAYHLAGTIPDDPVWSRWVHPAADLARAYPNVGFDALPNVAPSRDAVLWTANNQMYGTGYPLRLSAQFTSPYRAYRIAQLLRARSRYDVDYFARMQMDVVSVAERRLARELIPSLADWNGAIAPDSSTATAIVNLRLKLTNRHNGGYLPLPTVLRDAAHAAPVTLPSAQPWGIAGAVTVKHPLASLGLSMLNGTTLPGDGDSFTVHVLAPNFSQSFHAVWDVGNWNAGGITIPQGESGQPGSPHYTDQAQAWVDGKLLPLPYSRAAVIAATVDRLTLLP